MKLSIIVPVYNAEKYLDKTISNILGQTFTDFELILIDDGSKDNSGNICEEWRKKDSRIKVLRQDNTGVGGARNAGLDIAQGEYIGFVDNDDLIHPQMYEILIGIAEKENVDIVMSVEQKINADEKPEFEIFDNSEIEYRTLDKEDVYKSLYSSTRTDGPFRAVWNKIYNRKIIGSIRFPTFGAEDAVFNNRVYGLAKGLTLLDKNINLYYWMQIHTSQYHDVSSGYQVNMLESQFQMTYELDLLFPEYSHFAKEKNMKMILLTRYCFRDTVQYNRVLKIIKTNMKTLRKKFIKDKRIKFSHKIALLGFYRFPFTYSLLMNLMG